MIWSNPFLLKQTESVSSESDFLQLFSAEALSFLKEDSFSKIQLIQSSPGAGKTTIFKALQPDVLTALHASKESDDLKSFMKVVSDFRIIEGGEVKLLSCIMSCTKNYGYLDELYSNGRRRLALFALINVRVTILFLQSIMKIKALNGIDDLRKVTFHKFTAEFSSIDNITNGYDLYDWARKEERRICHCIDSLSDDNEAFPFYFSTLFTLRLFEPSNVLFEDIPFLNYAMVAFDDFQKLTENQKNLILEDICTLRPSLAVWIGARYDVFSQKGINGIVLPDASFGREYARPVELEAFWSTHKRDEFKKVLASIADRRVGMANVDNIKGFSSCLQEECDYRIYANMIYRIIREIKENIERDHSAKRKYQLVINKIDDENMPYRKALKWILLDILYRRSQRGQQSIDFGDQYAYEEFEEFCSASGNRNAAEFYLATRAEIPYYYGMDKLREVSSYNVEQFLSFAGAIFDKSIAKRIISRNKAANHAIDAETQEICIKEIANQRWLDIIYRFPEGNEVQTLLNNLCLLAQKTRDSGTNAYSGGSITGIAILQSDVPNMPKKLQRIIAICLASNYFEKRLMVYDGRPIIVLYFNRWLCVKYQLPLKYGGWKRMSIDRLEKSLYTVPEIGEDGVESAQISFFK